MSQNKQTKKPTNTLKKIVSRTITIGCVGVFIYSAYTLFGIFMGYYENRQVLADAQEIFHEYPIDEGIEIEELKEGEIRPQFNELRDINTDIVGWISIEDTQLNYPILQSANNDAYLNQNYKGEHAAAGSIFMDYRIDITSDSPNTILYGHRMKDGSMFDGLTKFLDKSFFDDHKVVKFDTLYESYDAEIFSVYQTTTDFDYIQTDFGSEEEYRLLLDEIQQKSEFATDTVLNTDDQIITLSTCDYKLNPDTGRLVVHAKLVKKG